MRKDNLLYKIIESGNYDIRRDGTIFSLRTKREVGYTAENGYRRLKLTSKLYVLVHRLIYAKYGPDKLDPKLVINHKDGNPLNNSIDNLEQVTQGYNNLHKFRVLGNPPIIGNKKITKEKAEEIRELRKQGWKYKELMSKFKVSKATISEVCNKKIWK